MPLKYCFAASKIVRKNRFLERIRTLHSNSSTMQCVFSYNVGNTPVTEDWDRKIASNKIWTILRGLSKNVTHVI